MHPFCRRYSLCRSRKGKYDSKISRVLIDLAKLNTLNRTTAAVCRELIKEITLVTYKIYDPDSLFTLKQQLPNMSKSFTKVSSSNADPFIQIETKQKKMPTKNQSIPNYQFQNERNQSWRERWLDELTIWILYLQNKLNLMWSMQPNHFLKFWIYCLLTG